MTDEKEGGGSFRWHNRRWLVIAVIFFAIIAMAIVGIYSKSQLQWYMSSEKMLLNALNYAEKTPGTYTVKTKDSVANIRYDGDNYAAKGSYKTVDYDAVLSGTTLYVKTTTPNAFLELFIPEDSASRMKPLMDSMATRMKDRWVALSLQNFPETVSSESSYVKCFMTAKAYMMTNKPARKELADGYDKNKFVTVEKTNETENSRTLHAAIDGNTFTEFMTFYKESSAYESLKSDCGSLVSTVEKVGQKDGNVNAVILLNQSKESLQELSVSAGDDEMLVDVRYGDVGKIVVPTESVSYSSISNTMVQSLIKAYLETNR